MAFYFEYNYIKYIDPNNLSEFNNYMKNSVYSNLYEGNFNNDTSVTILVNSNLDQSNIDNLGILVQDYIPTETIISENPSIIITSTNKSTNNIQWTNLFSWVYTGLINQSMKKIRFTSYINNENNSNETYSLRLYNSSNNTNIFIFSESNSQPNIYTIDTLSNIPLILSTIELHAKVSNSNLTMFLNNFSIIT